MEMYNVYDQKLIPHFLPNVISAVLLNVDLFMHILPQIDVLH